MPQETFAENSSDTLLRCEATLSEWYLPGMPQSPAHPVASMLAEGDAMSEDGAQKLQTLTRKLLGVHCEWFAERICRTAIAILWLALHQQEVDPMLATTLSEAAGLKGRQRLILSSSARVSRVTYETVIAVRYPELDSKGTDEAYFGTYLADQSRGIPTYLLEGPLPLLILD